MSDLLSPGTPAPDFELPSGPDGKMSLRQLRGKPVVLLFYPADWSPVCGDELTLFNEALEELGEAQVLGISVDGIWCHQAYCAARKLKFPLLADFEPKGAVARRYGAYRADGVAGRALFVIDRQGIIRWSHLSPIDQNPGVAGVLTALEAMAEGTLSA